MVTSSVKNRVAMFEGTSSKADPAPPERRHSYNPVIKLDFAKPPDSTANKVIPQNSSHSRRSTGQPHSFRGKPRTVGSDEWMSENENPAPDSVEKRNDGSGHPRKRVSSPFLRTDNPVNFAPKSYVVPKKLNSTPFKQKQQNEGDRSAPTTTTPKPKILGKSPFTVANNSSEKRWKPVLSDREKVTTIIAPAKEKSDVANVQKPSPVIAPAGRASPVDDSSFRSANYLQDLRSVGSGQTTRKGVATQSAKLGGTKVKDSLGDQPDAQQPEVPVPDNLEDARHEGQSSVHSRNRKSLHERSMSSRSSVRSSRSSVGSSLKGCLNSAKVVLEEEKSTAGSSNASSRSSLSSKDLSTIASQALHLAKSQSSVHPGMNLGPVLLPSRSQPQIPKSGSMVSTDKNSVLSTEKNIDVEVDKKSDVGVEEETAENTADKKWTAASRRSRTLTNVSHQDARRALKRAAKLKKDKSRRCSDASIKSVRSSSSDIQETSSDVSERLSLKAARAVALKKSSKVALGKKMVAQLHKSKTVKSGESGNEKQTLNPALSSVGSLLSIHSNDSMKSRRVNHPAFAGRITAAVDLNTSTVQKFHAPEAEPVASKPVSKIPAKVPPVPGSPKLFSETLFLNFRHFTDSGKTDVPKPKDRKASLTKPVPIPQSEEVLSPTATPRASNKQTIALPTHAPEEQTTDQRSPSPTIRRSPLASQSPKLRAALRKRRSRSTDSSKTKHDVSNAENQIAPGTNSAESVKKSNEKYRSTIENNKGNVPSVDHPNSFTSKKKENSDIGGIYPGRRTPPGSPAASQLKASSPDSVNPKKETYNLREMFNSRCSSVKQKKQSGTPPATPKKSQVVTDRRQDGPIYDMASTSLTPKSLSLHGNGCLSSVSSGGAASDQAIIISARSSAEASASGGVRSDKQHSPMALLPIASSDSSLHSMNSLDRSIVSVDPKEALAGTNDHQAPDTTQGNQECKEDIRVGNAPAPILPQESLEVFFQDEGTEASDLMREKCMGLGSAMQEPHHIQEILDHPFRSESKCSAREDSIHEILGDNHRREKEDGPAAVPEGSTSIRTGLSGLMNHPQEQKKDPDGSTSMRSLVSGIVKVEDEGGDPSIISVQDPPNGKSETNKAHVAATLSAPPHTYPNTIHEEEETCSVLGRGSNGLGLGSKQSNGGVTTTTTGSTSGPETRNITSGTFESSSAESGFRSDSNHMSSSSLSSSQPPHFLPPNHDSGQDEKEVESACDTSVVSSSISIKSQWWSDKFPNVIKNVLAKASPRQSLLSPMSKPDVKQQIATNPTESSEEDEDIFGGLDDENLTAFLEDPHHSQISKPLSKNQYTDAIVARTPAPDMQEQKSRRSLETARAVLKQQRQTRKPSTQKSSNAVVTATNTLKKMQQRSISPAATNTNSAYSNDRSGTIVDEQEVLNNVNSDITSSVIACTNLSSLRLEKTKVAITTKITPTVPGKKLTAVETAAPQTQFEASFSLPASPDSLFSKQSFPIASAAHAPKLSPTPTPRVAIRQDQQKVEEDMDTRDRSTRIDPPAQGKQVEDPDSPTTQVTADADKSSQGYFKNLSCGFSETIADICQFGAKPSNSDGDDEAEDKKTPEKGMTKDRSTTQSCDRDTFVTEGSAYTETRLTDLEKRIWSEWDRLDATLKPDKQEEHNKKREDARDKLLHIAHSAVSSQKDTDQPSTVAFSENSSSDSTETGASSEGSSLSETTGETTHCTTAASTSYGAATTSYSTASETKPAVDRSLSSTRPMAAPILLSFSQRSLVEKFSRKLAQDGVEVLKLNSRKKWQVRYFTVSTEQTALVAHEAKSAVAGEVAHCPRALLWLKAFNNSKKVGYSSSIIDKNGHGGMMLVNLVDVRVNVGSTTAVSVPKKFSDKFQETALVTLNYVSNGDTRKIEFCCKDNDEAQFLCTCMRVIRDLLKREQAMRSKS